MKGLLGRSKGVGVPHQFKIIVTEEGKRPQDLQVGVPHQFKIICLLLKASRGKFPFTPCLQKV